MDSLLGAYGSEGEDDHMEEEEQEEEGEGGLEPCRPADQCARAAADRRLSAPQAPAAWPA